MNFKQYISKILDNMKYNFDIYDECNYGGVIFDACAESHIRNEKYIATKKAVVYAFENDEKCLIKQINNITKNKIDHMIEVTKDNIINNIQLSKDHMSTTITVILVSETAIDEQIAKHVKRFRYQKSFMFGLKGWIAFRIILVDLENEKAICSKEARKVGKFYQPEYRCSSQKTS